jgi:hypothetical protein
MTQLLVLVAAAVLAATAQDARKAGSKVDQAKVDEAIRKGADYLSGTESPGWALVGVRNCDELLLLTLLHAGFPESHPKIQALLKAVLEAPLENVYKVATQAMALEDLDRVTYQARIWQCAQYLVDSQCANGQWSYGERLEIGAPPEGGAAVSTGGPKGGARDFGSPDGAVPRSKPRIQRKIPVRKTRDGKEDMRNNSTSQYAALGLRACHDAGILLPREMIERAVKWWRDSQLPESRGAAVATGSGGPGRGWTYGWNGAKETPEPTFGMTVGAVGSLVIYHYILGTDWKKDPLSVSGLNWVTSHFIVTENGGMEQMKQVFSWGGPKYGHFYALYALERLGVYCGTETFGPNRWYAEGARVILDAQRPDGSWNPSVYLNENVPVPAWDACFAILFLKRATRPLVASTDRTLPEKK